MAGSNAATGTRRDNVEKTYTASSGSAGSNPPKAPESPKFSVLVSVAAALGISAANFSISCSQFNKRTLLQQLQQYRSVFFLLIRVSITWMRQRESEKTVLYPQGVGRCTDIYSLRIDLLHIALYTPSPWFCKQTNIRYLSLKVFRLKFFTWFYVQFSKI